MGTMRSVAGGLVAALLAAAVMLGAGGPAGAETPETGWVVENPDPGGNFYPTEGTATVTGLAGGATATCPVVGGFGFARSGTLPAEAFFGGTGMSTYGGAGCTGPAPDLTISSTPDMVFVPETYDAAADRIAGSALPWLWALGVDGPDCSLGLYPPDPNAPSPLGYDNRTGTLTIGPLDVVVTQADGAGCAALGAVGDEMTFATTVVVAPTFTVRPLP